MEVKEHSGVIDHSEILTPSSESPATDIPDRSGSASGNHLASEEKKPALSQRLAVAFRDGVASANPDYEKRPEVKIPPTARNSRQDPGDGGILDKVIQEGGSAAAVVGDKAAGVLGAFVQLVKKAPALTQKYAGAFREGAALVRSREGGERREEAPKAAKKREAPSDGRAILDRVLKAGKSAAGFVREAVAVVNPDEVIGAGKKVRMCKKIINNLTIEIGREAVNSWNSGLVETEKLTALLDELRKNEEEILIMQAQGVEVAASKAAGAARSRETVNKEAAFTPATNKEDGSVDAGVSGAKQDEPIGQTEGAAGVRDLPQPENRHEVAFDVADASVSAVPDSESPEGKSLPEDTVDAEAVTQEEAGGGADQAMPEEPEVNQEKTEAKPAGAGAVPRRTLKRKGGRR